MEYEYLLLVIAIVVVYFILRNHTAPAMILVLAFLFPLFGFVSSDGSANASSNEYKLTSAQRGWFFTSLCIDRAGRLWAGTEDRGVVWYDPAARHWDQACAPSNFDDVSVYCVACDTRGGIWAGTLNHGLAFYDGQNWSYYGEYDGLRGEHVNAITVSPVDGSLWVATEAGITRRSDTNGAWIFYPTSVNGALVAPTCIAFGKDGELYVGTQCDGILIASPGDNYHTWRDVSGPAIMPTAPSGAGIGCSLINCLLVASNGAIWAGTDGSLACSDDRGKTWRYYCGRDWVAKQAGLPDSTDDTVRLANKEIAADKFVMSEDFVTSLAELPTGHLWIGHRAQPCDKLNLSTLSLEPVGTSEEQGADYAVAMLPGDGKMLIATYGNGLVTVPAGIPVEKSKPASPHLGDRVPAPFDKEERKNNAVADGWSTSFTLRDTLVSFFKNWQSGQSADLSLDGPSKVILPPDVPPSENRVMNAQLATLRNVTASPDEYKPFVAPLTDDWVTQGDWLGRYGGYWAVLAATVAPYDYVWGAAPHKVDYFAKMGPHHENGDTLRYWVEWLYTDWSRVLELPPTYLQSRILRGNTTADQNRRESEWDDHAESVDYTYFGPNVYVTVAVPTGLFRLSMYDLDKDGHTSMGNTSRDYRISIRQHPSDVPLDDIDSFPSMPELAHGRISNFCGGVWKRFAVRGPIDITIEVNKNYSFNTTLAAVTLDVLDGDPPPYYQTFSQYQKLTTARKAQWATEVTKEKAAPARPVAAVVASKAPVADLILANLDRLKYTNTQWWCSNKDEYYPVVTHWFADKVRSAQESNTSSGRADEAALARCYYECALYARAEQNLTNIGQLTARQVEKSLQWDGVSGDGDGYMVVSSYLDSLHGKLGASKAGESQ